MNKLLRLIILVLLLIRLPFIAEGQRTTGGVPKSFTLEKNKRKLGEPSIPVNTIPVIDNDAELEKAKRSVRIFMDWQMLSTSILSNRGSKKFCLMEVRFGGIK